VAKDLRERATLASGPSGAPCLCAQTQRDRGSNSAHLVSDSNYSSCTSRRPAMDAGLGLRGELWRVSTCKGILQFTVVGGPRYVRRFRGTGIRRISESHIVSTHWAFQMERTQDENA